MKYICTLLAVSNIEQSKRFYQDILGLKVVADLGANVTLTGGIALQTKETWLSFTGKQDKDLVFENNATELYFEEDDLDSFINYISKFEMDYVHKVKEHSWGQRVVRFYDPDKHIIEVGENMVVVVKRFIASGLSIDETATKMDVPIAYIQSCLT